MRTKAIRKNLGTNFPSPQNGVNIYMGMLLDHPLSCPVPSQEMYGQGYWSMGAYSTNKCISFPNFLIFLRICYEFTGFLEIFFISPNLVIIVALKPLISPTICLKPRFLPWNSLCFRKTARKILTIPIHPPPQYKEE